jgi:hypothetical protein
MDKRPDSKEGTPPVQPAVNIEAEELFGLGQLVWLCLYRPERSAFHLGFSRGFAFSGALGCLVRWVFGPSD